jgi:hypothetical protein
MVIIEMNKKVSYVYSESWTDKMRKEYGVEFVSIKWLKERKNKKKVIGGFAIPLFPTKIWVYPNDKRQEIIAHELAHIKYMVNGFQIFFLFLILALGTYASSPWIVVVSLFGWVMIQEYYAFTTAREQMAKVGLESSKMSWKTVLKYGILFSTLSAFGLLTYKIATNYGLSSGTAQLIAIIVAFVLYNFVFDRLFYAIFKRIGK